MQRDNENTNNKKGGKDIYHVEASFLALALWLYSFFVPVNPALETVLPQAYKKTRHQWTT